MSDFNIGDKVFLECEVCRIDKSDNTYRLKHKDWDGEYSITSFVKDKALHPTDEAYNKGLNDAWNLAKKIVLPEHKGGYTTDEFIDIFGKNTYMSAMSDFTPQEALVKVKAYEKEHDEIKVGDVVRSKGCSVEGIVTKVYEIKIYRLFKDGSCDSISTKAKEDLVKTGRHFDSIDEFMRSADD